MKGTLLTALAVLVAPVLALAQAKGEVEELKIPMLRSVTKMKLVKIPAGTVEIAGKEKGSTEKVEIKSLWIGQTELSWEAYDDYRLCMDKDPKEADKLIDAKLRPSRPYANPDRGFGHQGFAAISIHPKAAVAYCKWLSELTGKKYRLPTEAEWEYVCRAGGAVEDLSDLKAHARNLDKVAWFDKNSTNDAGDMVSHDMGKKDANAWGLYDMIGNVGEWVVAADGKFVLKGGWYDQDAKAVHSRARAPYNIEWQMRDPQDPKSQWWLSDGPHCGFRIVRED